MIKLLTGLAGYKNIVLIFGVAMLANTTITGYFVSQYKDGQFAIAQQKAQEKYNKIKDQQQNVINQQAEMIEEIRARVIVKTRIVEKKVNVYVEKTIREGAVIECFDNAGLELFNDTIKASFPNVSSEPINRMPTIADARAGPEHRYIAMAAGSDGDISGLLF